MKYLITGGCGFLGSNICARLLCSGQQVAVYDNLSRYGSVSNLEWLRSQGSFQFRQADIRDVDSVNSIVQSFQPDVVFHLAGQVAMTTSLENPRLDFEINALGTLNVLEALRICCPGAAIVYSSTNKVYGDLEYLDYVETPTRYSLATCPKGLPETLPLDFHSPYGCSKGTADQYVLDYCRMYGIRSVVFRHSSMYGGRQFATIDQGWIGWFCGEALRQAAGDVRPFTISGNGKQVRDLLHADDTVDLYLLASERIEQIAGRAFNIGGGPGNSMSILELLSFLQERLGTKLTYQTIAVRSGDQRVFIADISSITGTLNWTPRVTSAEGVVRMLEWVRGTV